MLTRPPTIAKQHDALLSAGLDRNTETWSCPHSAFESLRCKSQLAALLHVTRRCPKFQLSCTLQRPALLSRVQLPGIGLSSPSSWLRTPDQDCQVLPQAWLRHDTSLLKNVVPLMGMILQSRLRKINMTVCVPSCFQPELHLVDAARTHAEVNLGPHPQTWERVAARRH